MTSGEIALARTVFGNAIEYSSVLLKRRKWWPFQPKRVAMAPNGNIYFHPEGRAYCDDYAFQPLSVQGFFIHEMTHVWQTQTKGRWFLILKRHPFCSYSYSLKPGAALEDYGIEQQAEIVKHAFMLRHGAQIPGVGDKAAYDRLVAFAGATLN